MSENTVLQCSEGMFHGCCSQSHDFPCGALLHALQGSFVEMTGDKAPRTDCTEWFQLASSADLQVALVDSVTILSRELLEYKRLTGWTLERIGPLVIVTASIY